MDRKTLVLLLTEALLIVVLVVVIAMDFNKPVETKIASHAPAANEHKAVDTEKPAEAAAVAHKTEAVKKEVKHEEAGPAEKKTEKTEHKAEHKKDENNAQKSSAAPASASTEIADVVEMNHHAYAKHSKGIVHFSHKKHNVEYKLGCGECHHDDKGHALANLKMGDPAKDCIVCHNKTGKAAKGLKGAEKLKYHKNAIHNNCVGCHKAYNKKKKTKAAPSSCGKCHPKKKK